MKIKVWKAYTGNRASKPIEIGEYSSDDNEIHGAPFRYLIDNGNAIEIKDRTKEQIDNLENQARELTAENDIIRAAKPDTVVLEIDDVETPFELVKQPGKKRATKKRKSE